MSIRITRERPELHVIEGGRRPGRPATSQLALPDAPVMTPQELAAEMAELYALSLIRDVPFTALNDPHHAVWIDGRTRFTLHELLCELRSLSWFDGDAPSARGAAAPAVPGSLAAEGDADHRRGLRLNGDGQLTLRTLYRGAVARGGQGMRISAFHATDHAARHDPEPCERPSRDAPMSHWVSYVDRSAGAALALPGAGGAGCAPLGTPRALVERVRASHPCRIYYNAALMLLARGTAFDAGLGLEMGRDAPMTAQRLLALMAETAERAFGAAMSRQARAGRLSRPGVFSARFTAMAAREGQGGDEALRSALDELTTSAPSLLHWIARQNARDRGAERFAESLLLPLMPCGGGEAFHRADCSAQVVIAGALSTVMKALFDTRRHARLRMVGDHGGGVDIGAEADRLAADVALARSVSGGWFQAENHQDLRIGEALALQALRGWTEETGRNLSCSFVDFDGREVSLSAHPRTLGAAHATLRIDGRLVPWPLEPRRAGAHLAVV